MKIKKVNEEFISISTTKAGTWEKKEIKLDTLGLTSDNFQIFLFQGSRKESQIFYFDDIKLVKSNYVDNGLCSNDNKESKSPSSSTTKVLVVFFVFIILFAIGIGVFWFLRYKRRKNPYNEIETISEKTKLI